MSTKIFVNLPVEDLHRSVKFFRNLGFDFNAQFTDETAACMIVSGDIFVMLLTRAKFKEFTPKEICDSTKSTEVLVCLSLDSRGKVDDMVRKAVAAGGTTYAEPKDHGFMYQHGFQDPDGHIWELIYMDPSAIQQGWECYDTRQSICSRRKEDALGRTHRERPARTIPPCGRWHETGTTRACCGGNGSARVS